MDKSKIIDILLLRDKISLNEVLKGHIDYGKIKYDSQGLLICHICGKSFKSLSGINTTSNPEITRWCLD